MFVDAFEEVGGGGELAPELGDGGLLLGEGIGAGVALVSASQTRGGRME